MIVNGEAKCQSDGERNPMRCQAKAPEWGEFWPLPFVGLPGMAGNGLAVCSARVFMGEVHSRVRLDKDPIQSRTVTDAAKDCESLRGASNFSLSDRPQAGILSNCATPSAISWNACLSQVNSASCGPPNCAGSSIVPTLTTTAG